MEVVAFDCCVMVGDDSDRAMAVCGAAAAAKKSSAADCRWLLIVMRCYVDYSAGRRLWRLLQICVEASCNNRVDLVAVEACCVPLFFDLTPRTSGYFRFI